MVIDFINDRLRLQTTKFYFIIEPSMYYKNSPHHADIKRDLIKRI